MCPKLCIKADGENTERCSIEDRILLETDLFVFLQDNMQCFTSVWYGLSQNWSMVNTVLKNIFGFHPFHGIPLLHNGMEKWVNFLWVRGDTDFVVLAFL